MAATETGDGVTTETTDTTGASAQVETPSPYRPSAFERALDAGLGATLMFFGGVLVWRAVKPLEYAEWLSN